MYLLSYYEDRGTFEASLGGQISVAEVEVFQEELVDIIESLDGEPFNLLLDYSRVRAITSEVLIALGEMKDECHNLGAQKIVSVAPHERHVQEEQAFRLTHILQGTEEFVLDPSYARFTPVPREAVVLRAA